ncbi:MAG: DNA-3-methyladenine glycosylase I [Chitinophagales bacterium]|nr:DNA-3-methyladenine glycosylase I [Chitinophagales bacterium]MDW8419590.1 DNA-3-methyladenine glycosylase I [Chitinophagales bacterium]
MRDFKNRCPWCLGDPLYIKYHDEEWGVPVYDDHKLFEFLILESFQAGLSWLTILKKRENFRKAFAGFDAKRVAKFDEQKIRQLIQNEGIIRNESKIRAAVNNARLFLQICDEYGSFAEYVWSFTGHKTIMNSIRSHKDMPVTSAESDAMSRDMIRRGFKYRGSVICYAFMQAVGMVNDHYDTCFRKRALTLKSR